MQATLRSYSLILWIFLFLRGHGLSVHNYHAPIYFHRQWSNSLHITTFKFRLDSFSFEFVCRVSRTWQRFQFVRCWGPCELWMGATRANRVWGRAASWTLSRKTFRCMLWRGRAGPCMNSEVRLRAWVGLATWSGVVIAHRVSDDHPVTCFVILSLPTTGLRISVMLAVVIDSVFTIFLRQFRAWIEVVNLERCRKIQAEGIGEGSKILFRWSIGCGWFAQYQSKFSLPWTQVSSWTTIRISGDQFYTSTLHYHTSRNNTSTKPSSFPRTQFRVDREWKPLVIQDKDAYLCSKSGQFTPWQFGILTIQSAYVCTVSLTETSVFHPIS